MHVTKRRVNLIILTVGVLAVLVAWFLWRDGDQPRVYRPGDRPYGKTYGEWSARWWQWVSLIPEPENPLFGSRCPDVGQAGDVWFLTGTTEGTVVRECTVPAGKALFLPIWNRMAYNSPGETYTEEELRDLAAQLLGPFSEPAEPVFELRCIIDGVPVEGLKDNFRAKSPVFEFTYPEDNFHGDAPGTYFPAVSDGWWIMLKPLPVGTHEIRSYASIRHADTGEGISDLNVEIDVTHHLTVR